MGVATHVTWIYIQCPTEALVPVGRLIGIPARVGIFQGVVDAIAVAVIALGGRGIGDKGVGGGKACVHGYCMCKFDQ